jgi:TolB-like protein
MTLIAELQRRKVFKVGAAYLVVAWLAVQAASIAFPTFEAPLWALRVFILVALLGFPLALVMAWIFDVTPEGVRFDPSVNGTKRVLATATVLIALALVWYFRGQPSFHGDEHSPTTAAAPASGASALVASAKSIAVLPFENLSADKDNAFFADGIQDEILTGLAKVGGLKVISRTSTLRYDSKPPNLSAIARELGVANILEGSVQRVGNRVRVNVQLIDAPSDSHLWAETYDRDLADVFAVQSEIAQKIAESLKSTLTKDERAVLTTRPTDNPAAYEAYLKARALIFGSSSYDRKLVERTTESLDQAVTLDPKFALAWALLVQQHVWLYFSGFDSSAARLASAKTALERAEALAPDSPEVAMSRALYLYYGQLDFTAALAEMRKAQVGLPSDARVWYVSALLERRLGQWDAANADFAHARELSPNDFSVTSEYALVLFVQKRFAEALPLLEAALAMQPEDPSLLSMKVNCLWSLQDMAGATRMLDGLKSGSPIVLALRATNARYQRDFPRAEENLRLALAPGGDERTPMYFAGYIPAQVEWQLQLASLEQRHDPAAASRRYRQIKAMAETALSKPTATNVEVSWRLALAAANAGLGLREEAAAEALRAVALVPESRDALEGPTWTEYLARIYAMNDDAAHAVPLLAHLLQTKGSVFTPALLQMDPVWDPIRKDPGFQALLKEPGKP